MVTTPWAAPSAPLPLSWQCPHCLNATLHLLLAPPSGPAAGAGELTRARTCTASHGNLPQSCCLEPIYTLSSVPTLPVAPSLHSLPTAPSIPVSLRKQKQYANKKSHPLSPPPPSAPACLPPLCPGRPPLLHLCLASSPPMPANLSVSPFSLPPSLFKQGLAM
jgi:hypothetical protein